MISSLFLLAVGVVAGAFIGWHFPQPSWAKKVEEVAEETSNKVVDKVKEVAKKK